MTPSRIEQAIEEIQTKVHGYPQKAEEAAFLRQILSALIEEERREALLEANRRAEADMLAGRPITGAHSRAIEALLAEERSGQEVEEQP